MGQPSVSSLPILFALVAAASCPTQATGPFASTSGIVAVDSAAHLFKSTMSRYPEPATLVVRDVGTWQGVWSSLQLGDAPAVDFASDMVVLVAIGPRRSGGYTVEIERLERGADGATVQYAVTSPGANCVSAAVLTSPVDVVRVPRVEGAIRFVSRQVTHDC